MNDIKLIIENLKNTPIVLNSFIESIPVDKYDVVKKDGFWSIKEHIVHLYETQPMLYERLKLFKNEDNPVIKPYIPSHRIINDKIDINISELLIKFSEFRKKQLDLILTFDDKIWQKKAIHPEYESYGAYILLRHMMLHDYWHMYRIEELWLVKNL